MKDQIERVSRRVAQKKMSLARFKTMAVPFPPLTEQTRIVAEVERRLSVVEELEVDGERQSPACQRPSPKHPAKSVHGGTCMTFRCHVSFGLATARQARLRQSILQKAFSGDL